MFKKTSNTTLFWCYWSLSIRK